MHKEARLKAALTKAKRVAVHGPWSRAVEFRHLHTRKPAPLWGGASKIHGARFTPKSGFESIYLAWDSVTALAEVQSLAFLAGSLFQPLAPPWVLMSVKGIVSGVLDLTDPATLNALGTNEQEISGAWLTSAHPPTQLLAQVAYDSGIVVGIKYPSARNVGGGVNLVVFPDRLPLAATDFLEVFDPHGNLTQRIGA